eukprot:4403516-Prymnesium_polylepis.1
MAASGDSGGAVQDVGIEVRLQGGWHSRQNVRLQPLFVLPVSGEDSHRLKLIGKAQVLGLKAELVDLVVPQQVHLTRRL